MEEVLAALATGIHETYGLNTVLKSLKYLLTVHRYVPTEHTGEKEKRNLFFVYAVDRFLFSYIVYSHNVFYRKSFFPKKKVAYYKTDRLVVFAPQVKLYRSLAYEFKKNVELCQHVCLITPINIILLIHTLLANNNEVVYGRVTRSPSFSIID